MLISSEVGHNTLELVVRTHALRFGDEDTDEEVSQWERPDVDSCRPLIAPLYKIVIERLA